MAARIASISMVLRYPDGLMGLALLLLRLTSGFIAYPAFVALLAARFNWWTAASAAALLLLVLVAGIGTRVAAALLLLIIAPRIYLATGEIQALLVAATGNLAALILLGPGAYSIDAQRFGRRVIHLDMRSPDRGGWQ